MFCENCGNKLLEGHKFCMQCGHPNVAVTKQEKPPVLSGEKWWIRLARVIYIGLYVPLPFVLFWVWVENRDYCNYGNYPNYYTTCTDTFSKAFGYSLLTVVIWVAVLRLAKITFLYISLAQKPQWKKEFKKFL